MNDVDLKLIGDEDLIRLFKGLDDKVSHKVLKMVLSDSANIYVKEARKAVPVRSTNLKAKNNPKWHPPGTGKKSPIKKMGKSKRNPTVFVGPRTKTGDYKTDAWYLKFWERGTKYMTGRWGFKRTYESNERRVENNIFNSMRKILEREMRKYARKR